MQDLTLQVAAACNQMAVTVGQDTDSQASYRTDAPRQTADAVSGAPHLSARRLPPNSRAGPSSPPVVASPLALAYASSAQTGRGMSIHAWLFARFTAMGRFSCKGDADLKQF